MTDKLIEFVREVAESRPPAAERDDYRTNEHRRLTDLADRAERLLGEIEIGGPYGMRRCRYGEKRP